MQFGIDTLRLSFDYNEFYRSIDWMRLKNKTKWWRTPDGYFHFDTPFMHFCYNPLGKYFLLVFSPPAVLRQGKNNYEMLSKEVFEKVLKEVEKECRRVGVYKPVCEWNLSRVDIFRNVQLKKKELSSFQEELSRVKMRSKPFSIYEGPVSDSYYWGIERKACTVTAYDKAVEMLEKETASPAYRRIHQIRQGKTVRVEVRYKTPASVKYHLQMKTLAELKDNYHHLQNVRTNNNTIIAIMSVLCLSGKKKGLEKAVHIKMAGKNCLKASFKSVMPTAPTQTSTLKYISILPPRGPPLNMGILLKINTP